MNNINCPYCDGDLEINHDGGYGYEEGVKHEMECKHCEKSFVFETAIVFYYTPKKADCLNDGKHDYKLTHTHPDVFSKMQCTVCGDTRDLTEQERVKFKIGTIEDYFKQTEVV